MRSKLFVIFSSLVLAMAMMAQNATQSTPAPAAGESKTCACCNHDKTDAKAGETCGKDCCKEGKCAMKDGKMAGGTSCCSGDKCPMMAKDGKMATGKMADGKSCCSGEKCPMMAKGEKHAGCCCPNMDEHQHAGM
jgi:hypothetical protein